MGSFLWNTTSREKLTKVVFKCRKMKKQPLAAAAFLTIIRILSFLNIKYVFMKKYFTNVGKKPDADTFLRIKKGFCKYQKI